jgi:hypothetical protein
VIFLKRSSKKLYYLKGMPSSKANITNETGDEWGKQNSYPKCKESTSYSVLMFLEFEATFSA